MPTAKQHMTPSNALTWQQVATKLKPNTIIHLGPHRGINEGPKQQLPSFHHQLSIGLTFNSKNWNQRVFLVATVDQLPPKREISWSCVLSCFMSVASGSTALNRRQGKQMSIASAERHFPQDCCKVIVGYILLHKGHVFNRQSYQLCDWFLGFLMFPCILTRSDPFSQSKTIHYYLGPSKLFRLESRDVAKASASFCLRVVFRTCSRVRFSQWGFLLAQLQCYAMDCFGTYFTHVQT